MRFSIRKKLIISNVLIIAVPLAVALSLFAVFFNGPGDQYWETMEYIFDDDNGVYTVQSMMNTYRWKGDLKDTRKEMKAAGYHFVITKGGKVEYSDVTAADVAAAKKAAGDLYNMDTEYVVTKGSVTVVSCKNEEDSDFHGIAIHTSKIKAVSGDSYIKRYITLYLGFMILIVVAAVVLMNMIVSWWIARNILKPLKKIKVGSEMIRDGNLDFELTYNRKDEMGEAISNFDEMRSYLKDSVEERLRYEKYRKELINGISHDLRTPLTSIKGYVEGLRDGIATTPEKKLQYYEAIEKSVVSLEHLVDDLTSFSRVDMGGRAFETEKVELGAYFEDVVEEMTAEYSRDGLSISLEAAAEPVFADINRREMMRICHNLIGNTLKYRTADHSQVVIALKKYRDLVEIKISDDGPGVRAEELERIFECFYRSDESRTSPQNGSGIGLAVVRQITEGFGGTCRAENDHGLAIIMTLPLSREGDNDEENTHS
jgi:signal transduction histidine kinase